MKQEFDKEMEALLRGTRGGARGRLAHAAPTEAAHLDADALSAYAENALPPATRARHTAHLADCADCRRVVTAIALAASAEAGSGARAAHAAAVETPTAAPVRSWLAALFSPRALRYAAPVLALAIFGALALIVLRQRPLDGQVAQQPSTETEGRIPITQQAPGGTTNASMAAVENAPTTPEAKSAAAPDGNVAAGPVTGTSATAPLKDAERGEIPAPKSARQDAPEVGETAAVATDAAKAGVVAPGYNQVMPAAAPPASRAEPRELASAAQPADDKTRERKQDEAAAKSEEQEKARDDDEYASRRGTNMQRHRGGGDRIPERRYSKSKEEGPGTSGDYSVGAAKKNTADGRASNAAETRTVAGREFRRDGDAWVETRYNSSMAVANYKRGSESFRALVADIPEIGRVAEQLRGTVIVVARGRAYRIQ